MRVYGDTTRRVPGPALLWIHGGGYVFGTAAQDDRWCHQIATRTGVLVAVDSQLTVIPGAFHGFDTVAPTTTISRDLRRNALHTIHTAVTTPPR
ncbi:alpha/beta hydrolase [Nocardia jiangxiensis]|uniref:alpha/beta hydrolase n=1 Tax=Nocardia jiangxiensis TaxID=282685 RepID=UPI000594F2A6